MVSGAAAGTGVAHMEGVGVGVRAPGIATFSGLNFSVASARRICSKLVQLTLCRLSSA